MELWDLYDKDRNPVGKTVVRGEPIEDGYYHIVVHLCVFNSNKELLCQKRAANKVGFPGYWDITVGGSAIVSETSQMAMQRELAEELGLGFDFSNQSALFTLVGDHVFDDYYFLISDVDLANITLQKEEVSAVSYFDFPTIFKMVEEGTFIPYGQLEIIKQIADDYLFNQQ